MSAPMGPGRFDRVETERLLLRRPCEADRAALHAMYADPETMATLGGVKTPAETDETFRRLVAHWDAHDFGYWTVWDPEKDVFAGRAGLRMMDVEGEPAVELGYGLMAPWWGRGLATEIARACIRVAFEGIGLRELVCFTTPTNARSLRVMEKAGFRYERDFVHAGLPHRLHRLSAERWQTEHG